MPFILWQILKKYTTEIRKDVSVGQAVTFNAKTADLNLLMNNQDKLTISPALTRQGPFAVVISKDKIAGDAGKTSDQQFIYPYYASTLSSRWVRIITIKTTEAFRLKGYYHGNDLNSTFLVKTVQ